MKPLNVLSCFDGLSGVSNTQRYKMIGNGFTIEMIAHILNQLYKENK
jgi:site-specific DNA-cytosine methylase